jgi:hypothetical protein
MGAVWVAYGGVIAAAARLAAVVTVTLGSPAIAEDEETLERSPLSSVLFGSLEAGPTKTFVAVGLKKALTGGLATSGFRTLLKIGGAQEQARRQPPHGIAYKSEAQALIGYEWRIGDSFLSLYAGSDYEGEQREEAVAAIVTNRYGARLQGDLWMTPTSTTMLQASAYASTIDGRLWGRASPGWLVPQGFGLDGAYLGPEVEAYRGRDYTKVRLGLHLTGLRFLGVSWRVSGGWQRTSDRASEAYATLGLHWLR